MIHAGKDGTFFVSVGGELPGWRFATEGAARAALALPRVPRAVLDALQRIADKRGGAITEEDIAAARWEVYA